MTRIERLGDRLKKSFQRLSRSVTPEPPYDPHSHPKPLLNNLPSNAAPSASSSVSDAVAGASLLAVSTIVSPQPTTAGKASPLGEIPQKTVFQDDGLSPMPLADISPNEHSVTVASVDHTAWPGLKLLAGVLNTSTDIFGPLKPAVDAFVECTKTCEMVAEAREEYKTLRAELDNLFQDLSCSFGESMPPIMRPSIVNLARGIENEISCIRQKEHRNAPHRYIEALQDVDQVLYHYRRIHNLLERLTLNANINVWMIVDEQSTAQRLDKLCPSHAARYNSAESEEIFRNECTPDTRLQVLERLQVWREDDEGEKVYWLSGMAGTGKTTLAYTLCKQLEDENRLAASFFCSRQLPNCRDVKRILPTIVYQLANFSYPFRYALSQVLRGDPDVHTRRLSEQFVKLLYSPLHKVQDSLPCDLVVVIDGLDECENGGGVGEILDALLNNRSAMPIKFFLTSRPEPHISSRMLRRDGDRERFELHLHELNKAVVREDIKKYLQAGLKRANLSARDLQTLTERSGALFIYAAVAVRYVGAYDFSRSDTRLKLVLGMTISSSGKFKELDSLYTAILEDAFGDPGLDEQERREMRLVLDTVICAQEPMTIPVISRILGLGSEESVHAALGPLRSVLNTHKGEGVTALHKSFSDYMVDSERSHDFCCSPEKHHAMLAQRCFDLINTPNPPFNICNLESSYILDEDIPDLPKRLERHITRELLYACRYWGAHFQLSKRSHALHRALHSFLSTRLLLWMEIMNLNLDLFSLGASMLYWLKSLAGNQEYDAELQELTRDAYDFVNTYTSSPASHSTPHIYISTLAFWPRQKPLSKCYSGQILCPVEPPDQTAGKSNSSTPTFIYGIETGIRCTSFSPDSARVASGFNDGTVRTSCAYTGEMVVVLPGSHNKTVHSVMYASDGGRLVSGSEDGTVIIWDLDSDQMIGEPLRGHTGPVYSVSYSPTSDSVASGSADSTIRIWDIQSLPMASKCLEGHTGSVSAIAHSPGGEFVVSGSSGGTIRIWNIDTCQHIGEPLYSPTKPICSITYSADGESIISGAVDGTICLWDAQSGQMLAAPSVQHIDAIFSTILLPGGRKFISRLDDDAIGVWDVSKKVTASADDDYTYLHSLGDEAEQRQDAPLVRRVAYPRFDNALGLGFCSAFDDEGWLVAGSSRLAWVPPNIRDFLWHPQGEVIVSDQFISNMSVGDKWQQCYQPALQCSDSTTRPSVTLCDTRNLWSIQGLKVIFFDKNSRRKHKKQGEGFRH